MQDESSETSTPEPLIRRKRVVETQEVAATPEPPAPVADTTSPQ